MKKVLLLLAVAGLFTVTACNSKPKTETVTPEVVTPEAEVAPEAEELPVEGETPETEEAPAE